MNPNEARLVLNTVLTIVALVAVRLVAAAYTPITFDEAYYWMWSKHLAGGYYYHPPMVAVVIARREAAAAMIGARDEQRAGVVGDLGERVQHAERTIKAVRGFLIGGRHPAVRMAGAIRVRPV